MNNYDLSTVNREESKSDTISPYVGYGTGQILKINRIELKKSQNTGSSKAILHMETKPITDENFSPVDGAKGKVGKIACGVYMNSEPLKREFLQKMKTIAVAIGAESQINEVKGDTFEEVVDKIEKVIKGKYAKYTVVASEYAKPDGKIGITLSLPKFKFVEHENADPSTIIVFDKTNNYHYKKIPVGETTKSGYTSNGSEHESKDYGSSYSSEPISSPDDSDLPF